MGCLVFVLLNFLFDWVAFDTVYHCEGRGEVKSGLVRDQRRSAFHQCWEWADRRWEGVEVGPICGDQEAPPEVRSTKTCLKPVGFMVTVFTGAWSSPTGIKFPRAQHLKHIFMIGGTPSRAVFSLANGRGSTTVIFQSNWLFAQVATRLLRWCSVNF